jgi:hypothetical protein
MLIVLGLAANEIQIGSEAGELARTVATYDFDKLPSAWNQYDSLRDRSRLGFGTSDLEDALTRRTTVLVDRIIANYRTPNPTVREAQWMAARDALDRALSFAGDNRDLRGALRYCEGISTASTAKRRRPGAMATRVRRNWRTLWSLSARRPIFVRTGRTHFSAWRARSSSDSTMWSADKMH